MLWKVWFKGHKEITPMKIYMGDDTTLETISILGDVENNMSMGNEIIDGIFKDVLYVPRLLKIFF